MASRGTSGSSPYMRVVPTTSPAASRTAKASTLPPACASSAASMNASTRSGAGTLVYQSRCRPPSSETTRKASAWAGESGSSTAWPPARTGASRQACRDAASISADQGGLAGGAVGHAALDMVEAGDAVPEHFPLLLLDAAVGLGVVEDVDLVVVARAPEQLRRLLAHHVPDRAAEAFALGVVQHRELVQVHAFGGAHQDHRGTVVLAHVGAQQVGALEVVRHQLATEAGLDQRLHAGQVQVLPRLHPQHALAAPHQGARTLVGEQLLGQVRRAGDRHRGLQRQAVQQVLDLLDLDLHAAMDPRLPDQVLVLGRQVDRIDDPAVLVEQAAGAGKEDDLVRLQFAHQLVGGEVGVDVDDLAAGSLAQAGDHRDRAGVEAGLDRRKVDLLHLADQAVGVAIHVIGLEHAAGDRGGAHAVTLERLDQLEV